MPAQRRYLFPSPLWQSFSSRRLYQEVAYLWKGTALMYLVGMAFLVASLATASVIAYAQYFQRSELPYLRQSLPKELKIANGVASTPEAKAYEVKMSDGTLIMVFDTRPDVENTAYPNSPVLITSKAIISRGAFVYIAPWPPGASTEEPEQILRMMCIAGPFVFFIFLFFYCAGSWMFLSLVLSIFTVLLARAWKRDLDYLALLRLTVIARIPAIFLSIPLLPGFGSYAYILGFIINLVYIAFALSAASEPPVDDEEEEYEDEEEDDEEEEDPRSR